jgi:quercetin dioxygenase-like cupin family protein
MPDCVDRYLASLSKPSLDGVHSGLDKLTQKVGQSRDEVRSAMAELGQEMAKINDYKGEYDHSVVNRMYRRTVFMKAGSLVETKIHTEHNFSFVMKGRARVISEEGDIILEAPSMFITEPGTKRILAIEEDMVFVTMHPNPTNSTDFEQLEDRLSVWTFEELENRVPFLEIQP